MTLEKFVSSTTARRRRRVWPDDDDDNFLLTGIYTTMINDPRVIRQKRRSTRKCNYSFFNRRLYYVSYLPIGGHAG